MFQIRFPLIVVSVVVLAASMVLTAASIHAQIQPPEVEWQETFGGANEEWGHSVQQTKDGGYIIAGETSSFGPGVYLVKTDDLGTLVWQKNYGGSRGDAAYSVQQTTDGGYVVGGYTWSFGAGDSDVYLIKTDSTGNQLWQKTYGGANQDYGYSVQQTTDGGYVVAGYTNSFGAGNSDVYLVKTDDLGNMVWQKTFGGISDDDGSSVQQTQDGGYVVAGYTDSFGAGDDNTGVYLVKTDDLGNMVWQKTFGGQRGDDGEYPSVQQTQDGSYIVTSAFGDESRDVYLIKTDANGNVSPGWPKTFGGAGDDAAYSVQQTTDGGYVMAGYTNPVDAGGDDNVDVYLVKTDDLGNMVWQKTVGGISTDEGSLVQQTQDGGYIIAGGTDSFGAGSFDVYLIKLCPEQPDKPPPGFFIRGDADPSCTLNLTDAVFILNYLFLGGRAPPCADAADVDDNGKIELTDAIYTLNYLFLGGPQPPPPFPSYGTDPTPDDLGCDLQG